MAGNVPFFEMFRQLQLSPELRLKLLTALVTNARFDQDARTAELSITVEQAFSEEDRAALADALRTAYGMTRLDLTINEKLPAAPAHSGEKPKGGK
ncbi:MAG: hypothetical protein IKN53_03445 [Oscillibacter sp.]|nr:hypothetical protein [Oscillibacter sp.]